MENIDMEALSTDIQVHASMLKHTHIRTSFPEVTIACCFAELYEEDFYLLLIKSESWRILCFTLESLKHIHQMTFLCISIAFQHTAPNVKCCLQTEETHTLHAHNSIGYRIWSVRTASLFLLLQFGPAFWCVLAQKERKKKITDKKK